MIDNQHTQKSINTAEISFLEVVDQLSGYQQKMNSLLTSIKFQDSTHYHSNNGGLLKQFHLLNNIIINRIHQISVFLTNKHYSNIAEALQCIFSGVIKAKLSLINKILELIQVNQFMNNKSAIDRQKYILCYQCGKNLQTSKLQGIKRNLTLCQAEQLYQPKKKAEKLKQQFEAMTMQPFFNRESYQYTKQIELALAGKNNPHLHRKSTTYQYLMEYLLTVEEKNLTLNFHEAQQDLFKDHILRDSQNGKNQKEYMSQNNQEKSNNMDKTAPSNFMIEKRFDKMFLQYMNKSMQKPLKRLITKTHEIIESKYKKIQPILDEKGTQTSLLKPSEIMLNLQKANENLRKEVELIRTNKRKLETEVLKYIQNQKNQDSKILQYSSRIKILQHQLSKNTHNYTKLEIRYKQLQKKYKDDLDTVINEAMNEKHQLKQQIKQLTRKTESWEKNIKNLSVSCQTHYLFSIDIETQTDFNNKNVTRSLTKSSKKQREQGLKQRQDNKQINQENKLERKMVKINSNQSQGKQNGVEHNRKPKNMLKKVQLTISEQQGSKAKKRTMQIIRDNSKESQKTLQNIKNRGQQHSLTSENITNNLKVQAKIVQFKDSKQQSPIKEEKSVKMKDNQHKRNTSIEDIDFTQEKDKYYISLKKCQFSKTYKKNEYDMGLLNSSQHARSNDNFSLVLSQYALGFIPTTSKKQVTSIKKKPLHNPKLKHLGKNQLPFLKLLKYHQNQQEFEGYDYQFTSQTKEKIMKLLELQFKFFEKIGLMNFLDDIAKLKGYVFDNEKVSFVKTSYQFKDWRQTKKDMKIATRKNINDNIIQVISQYLKDHYQPPNKNDIVLFVNDEQARKFEKKIGYWQQLDSMLVVDNSFGQLCDLINSFFQILKIVKVQIFEDLINFLNKPCSYLYGNLQQKISAEYTKSLQIPQVTNRRGRQSQLLNLSLLGQKLDKVLQREESVRKVAEKSKRIKQQTLNQKFSVRDLFKKLVRMHKLMHKNCSHIQQFLNKYGFKIYLEKKNVTFNKLI